MIDETKIREALDRAIEAGETNKDELRLAEIEALLRDALGQSHGVWNWRVKPAKERRA